MVLWVVFSHNGFATAKMEIRFFENLNHLRPIAATIVARPRSVHDNDCAAAQESMNHAPAHSHVAGGRRAQGRSLRDRRLPHGVVEVSEVKSITILVLEECP